MLQCHIRMCDMIFFLADILTSTFQDCSHFFWWLCWACIPVTGNKIHILYIIIGFYVLNTNADTKCFTFYHSSCPAVSAQVFSSSSILSSSCSMSSSIISSCPVASSRAVRVQYCRPRCLWPRRTLRLRPFLFVPNEDDWDEQEDEGEHGLDFNGGLCPCIEEREGGWLVSVWQPEEMQGAWYSWSGCGADVEDGQTVEESGAS